MGVGVGVGVGLGVGLDLGVGNQSNSIVGKDRQAEIDGVEALTGKIKPWGRARAT